MMDLVIGKTSQLARHLPSTLKGISSRLIDEDTLAKEYNRVFITFAEQRTFNKNLVEKDFVEINVDYTSWIINKLYANSQKIIVYGTAELWNSCHGPINIETEIKYNYSPYIKSKEILWNLLLEKRAKGEWGKVVMIHPVNFNSTQRKSGFLFHKIFQSIIHEQVIDVGDLGFERDMIHAKYLAQCSMTCESDCIIGSGLLTNVRQFIQNLYAEMDLNYYEYVNENLGMPSLHRHNAFWVKKKIY